MNINKTVNKIVHELSWKVYFEEMTVHLNKRKTYNYACEQAREEKDKFVRDYREDVYNGIKD